MLRDVLAGERTMLANERTLLAYMRTSIMLFISGVTVLKVFGDEPPYIVIGWLLIPLGIMVASYGYTRFVTMRGRIQSERNPVKESQSETE